MDKKNPNKLLAPDLSLGKRRLIEAKKEEATKSCTTRPSFLVVRCTEEGKSLTKLSPFLIYKGLKSVVGEPKSVSKLHKSMELLVEVDGKTHSDGLLRCRRLCDLQVEVMPHKSLNTSRGVISSRDLLECSEKEIVEGIEGVIHARRITRRRDGEEVKTATIILTFGTRTPPEYVKAGYLRVPVRPYIPNPMRCFKCQGYGHDAAVCKRNTVCARCAGEGHEDKGCTAQFKCPNCQAGHSAYSKDCPVWKQEVAVQEYKARNGCTFSQAKSSILALPKGQFGLTKTYAQAVAKIGRSIATQTDTLTPPPPPPPPTQKKTPPKNTPLKKQESPVVMLKNRFSVLADESMETEQHVKINTPGEPGDIMSDTGSPQRTQPDTPTSTELEVDQLPKGRNQSGEDARGERGGNDLRSNQRDLPSPERKTSPKRGLSSSPSKPKNKNTKVTGIKGNPSGGLPRPNSSK
ncbi:uncharacterized protein LOC129925206 [Biomphalaria glabrata]|uniref:Uncharacterized protein LOC129925206 n=1 Tax=Biomphalaria glabrata TaxID=6526 RepID=A0A9W2ZYT3_BIOGL|nr:uncharacterized protein LOC129925206 [Biomphalaria glabrata]